MVSYNGIALRHVLVSLFILSIVLLMSEAHPNYPQRRLCGRKLMKTLQTLCNFEIYNLQNEGGEFINL